MKKITFLFTVLLITVCNWQAQAQFPEGFEATVPPAGWASFIGTNGVGTAQNWTAETTLINSGAQAAMVSWENVTGGLAEDWLVTPQFTPTAGTPILTFMQRQAFSTSYGSTYTIRVSTASQTTHADFTIIDTQAEADFNTIYNPHNIDLSAYIDTPIYIAFVMTQDNGDSWYIDDVDLVGISTPPNCADTPSPADTATNAVLTGGNVTLSWASSTTGDSATSYEIFMGTTSGSLTSLGSTTATTVNISGIGFSATRYWMIVPNNAGGAATGCPEWSFTTADFVLPATTPITPSAEGTGCTTPTFINSTAGDGTTDSGFNSSCNGTNTGLDRFYTWTATSLALVYNFGDGATGISIREATAPYTEITCAPTFASLNTQLTGWAINQDLIIQIYDYGTADVDTSFCLETRATPIPVPDNDDCANATLVNVLPYNNTLDASAATNNAGYITTCSDANDGVWYTFTTVDAGTIDIALTNVVGWDASISLYSGSCGTFTCLGAANSGIVGENETLTGQAVAANTQYWINIAFPSATVNRAEGPFTIDITTADTTTLDVESNNIIEGFLIYPNPVSNVVRFNAEDTIDSIRIYNLLGQEIIRRQPKISNTQIDMTNLSAGVYIIKVQVGEQSGSYRIVKK